MSSFYGFSHGHGQYLHENDDGLNALPLTFQIELFFPLKSSLSCLIIIGNKIWNDDNKFGVTSKPSTTLKTANFGKMCSWGNKQNQEIHKTLFLPSMALYELIITVIKCSHGVRMLEVFLTAHENLKCCKFYLLEPTHNP